MDQTQENGRRYIIFVDSTAETERVRSDNIGPGQHFAMAAIEVSTWLQMRGNEIMIRWVPAHQGASGNEKADECARAAMEGEEPEDAVLDEYRWETSLSHGHRGPGTDSLSVNCRTHRRRPTKVPPSTRKGPQVQSPSMSTEFSGRSILSADVGPCAVGPTSGIGSARRWTTDTAAAEEEINPSFP